MKFNHNSYILHYILKLLMNLSNKIIAIYQNYKVNKSLAHNMYHPMLKTQTLSASLITTKYNIIIFPLSILYRHTIKLARIQQIHRTHHTAHLLCLSKKEGMLRQCSVTCLIYILRVYQIYILRPSTSASLFDISVINDMAGKASLSITAACTCVLLATLSNMQFTNYVSGEFQKDLCSIINLTVLQR